MRLAKGKTRREARSSSSARVLSTSRLLPHRDPPFTNNEHHRGQRQQHEERSCNLPLWPHGFGIFLSSSCVSGLELASSCDSSSHLGGNIHEIVCAACRGYPACVSGHGRGNHAASGCGRQRAETARGSAGQYRNPALDEPGRDHQGQGLVRRRHLQHERRS